MGTTADKLNKLKETKQAIKTAIVNKGVDVTDTDTFASYASKIDSIQTGGSGGAEIYGVFIYDDNGNLTKPEEWNTANNAVGVAVIDEYCSFIIGKEAAGVKTWSASLYGTNVPGLPSIAENDIAQADYAGEYNSSIVRGLTTGEDNAFNWAYSNTITVNGTTLYGYVGAIGEWKTAYNNKAAIDNALSIIGGTDIVPKSYIWTSTQGNKDISFTMIWNQESYSNQPKNTTWYVRAFYHLDYPKNNGLNKRICIVHKPNYEITNGENFDQFVNVGNNSYPRFVNTAYNAKGGYLSDLCVNTETIGYRYAPVGTLTINAEDCDRISYLFGDSTANKYFIGDLNLHINTSDKLTNLSYMLYNCLYKGDLSISNTSKVINFSYAFKYYKNPEFKELDTSSGTNFSNIFSNCLSLIKIAGLSLKSLDSTFSYYYFTGFDTLNNLRYVLLKDLGTGSKCTSAQFGNWKNWGVEDESIGLSTGATQALKDSLITNSFDRATAGYPVCSISLSTNTKALLSEDEIAQITAKGFTIA